MSLSPSNASQVAEASLTGPQLAYAIIFPASLLPIGALLITIIFHRKVSKPASLINFLLACVLQAFVSQTLLWSGFETKAFETIPEKICQLSLAFANSQLQPMSVSSLLFMLKIYSICASPSGNGLWGKIARESGLVFWILLALPWVVFLAVFVVTYVVAGNNTSTFSRHLAYCIFDVDAVNLFALCLSAVCLLGVVVLEIFIARALYNSARIRNSKFRDGPLIIRALAFGLMVSVNVVLLLINIVDSNFLGADLLSACNPWISFFIFASQPDVLRAWHVPVPAFLGSRDESNEVSLSEGSRSHKMNKIRNGQLQSRMDKDPEMDDESTRYFNGGINVTTEVEVVYDTSPPEPYSSSTITLSKDYAQGGKQITPFDV